MKAIPFTLLGITLFQSDSEAQSPLFISEQGKDTYLQAYDALLNKYNVSYQDLWIDTYLGKAHLIETGKKEGKAIMMLHAVGVSSAEWYANYNALGEKYHLYALDMPGDAGKSELYTSPEKIEDYQLTVLQILDSLKLDKVTLLGHSLGGFFAAGFTLAHPERVEQLILLSPVTTHVPLHWYFKLLLKKQGKPGKGPKAKKILKMQAYKGFEPDPEFVALMESVRDYTRVNVLFPYVYSNEKLASIQVPVTLIIGTKEVLCRYKKSVRLAKKKIPGIKIHTLHNTGHTPNIERPSVVNELLLSILNL